LPRHLAAGRPGNGPRFTANPDRVAHHDELTAIIEDCLASRSAGEVSDMLDQAGIAGTRLRTPEEFTRHPQLRARGRWRHVRTPGGEIDARLPPLEVAGQRKDVSA
jgi:crotonobetainyl-CoA:carnitine CoA-transferase CaiB-like acyl-CoA transferase